MHEVGECLRRLRDARDDARSQLALAQGHVDALARSLHATCVARDESRDRADALEEVRVSLVANVEDYRERCEAIAIERDEARAEVERLRHERRMFRRRLAECIPWVGVVPYPNTKGSSEMVAVRDLAIDTLEDVSE